MKQKLSVLTLICLIQAGCMSPPQDPNYVSPATQNILGIVHNFAEIQDPDSIQIGDTLDVVLSKLGRPDYSASNPNGWKYLTFTAMSYGKQVSFMNDRVIAVTNTKH